MSLSTRVVANTIAGLLALSAGTALAGGVSAASQATSQERVRELRAHYASRRAALAHTFAETQPIVAKVAMRNANRTALVVPTKDRFGDPMYVHYGKRAYAGTPWYNGPAYTASFEIDRQISYGAMEGVGRLYWSGSLGDPGSVPRTDVSLGVGASSSYVQHGMVVGPGSVAPSHTRPMQFNNR